MPNVEYRCRYRTGPRVPYLRFIFFLASRSCALRVAALGTFRSRLRFLTFWDISIMSWRCTWKSLQRACRSFLPSSCWSSNACPFWVLIPSRTIQELRVSFCSDVSEPSGEAYPFASCCQTLRLHHLRPHLPRPRHHPQSPRPRPLPRL